MFRAALADDRTSARDLMKLPCACCWRRADEGPLVSTRDANKLVPALDIDSARVSGEWGLPIRTSER